MNFVLSEVEICEICHKVSKCHVLYETKDEKILVCGTCDSE